MDHPKMPKSYGRLLTWHAIDSFLKNMRENNLAYFRQFISDKEKNKTLTLTAWTRKKFSSELCAIPNKTFLKFIFINSHNKLDCFIMAESYILVYQEAPPSQAV